MGIAVFPPGEGGGDANTYVIILVSLTLWGAQALGLVPVYRFLGGTVSKYSAYQCRIWK